MLDYRLTFIVAFALLFIILVDRTFVAWKKDKVVPILFWGALVLFDLAALLAIIMKK